MHVVLPWPGSVGPLAGLQAQRQGPWEKTTPKRFSPRPGSRVGGMRGKQASLGEGVAASRGECLQTGLWKQPGRSSSGRKCMCEYINTWRYWLYPRKWDKNMFHLGNLVDTSKSLHIKLVPFPYFISWLSYKVSWGRSWVCLWEWRGGVYPVLLEGSIVHAFYRRKEVIFHTCIHTFIHSFMCSINTYLLYSINIQ